jgi:hypothetical protein
VHHVEEFWNFLYFVEDNPLDARWKGSELCQQVLRATGKALFNARQE